MKKAFIIIALIVLGQTTIDSRLPDAIRCGGDGTIVEGAIFVIHNFKAWDTKTIHYYQIYTVEHRYLIFNADGSYHTSGGQYDSRRGCQGKSLATLDLQGRTIYYALDPSKGKNPARLEDQNAIKNRITKIEERQIIADKKLTKTDEEEATIKILMAKMGDELAGMKSKMAKFSEEGAEMKRKITKMEQQQAIKDKKIEKLENKNSELKKKLLSFSSNFWDYEQIKEKWVKEFKREMLTDIKEKGLQIGSRWKVQQEGAAFVIRDLEGSKVKDSRIFFTQDTFSNPK